MKLKTVALSLALPMTLALSAMTTTTANAGEAVIYWEDITKFSDVDAGVNSQPKFNRKLKKAMSNHFGKLAEQLPTGYKWEVQIHDVNLAGKISRAYRNDREPLRVYDTFFNPSMEISYRVSDDKGKVIANDKHFKLTDHYVDRYRSEKHMQRFLSYEKMMMNAWFKKVLLPFVEQA